MYKIAGLCRHVLFCAYACTHAYFAYSQFENLQIDFSRLGMRANCFTIHELYF